MEDREDMKRKKKKKKETMSPLLNIVNWHWNNYKLLTN
jgi:hypothetical protein